MFFALRPVQLGWRLALRPVQLGWPAGPRDGQARAWCSRPAASPRSPRHHHPARKGGGLADITSERAVGETRHALAHRPLEGLFDEILPHTLEAHCNPHRLTADWLEDARHASPNEIVLSTRRQATMRDEPNNRLRRALCAHCTWLNRTERCWLRRGARRTRCAWYAAPIITFSCVSRTYRKSIRINAWRGNHAHTQRRGRTYRLSTRRAEVGGRVWGHL